jgi:hypothetical protein
MSFTQICLTNGTECTVDESTVVREPHPLVPLTPPISKFHHFIDLYMDFLFVNKIPFLHTKSKNLNFLSIQSFKKRTISDIADRLREVINVYQSRGLEIKSMHGDNEFNIEYLRDFLRPIMLHIYGRNEHISIAERSIRTIKEGTEIDRK